MSQQQFFIGLIILGIAAVVIFNFVVFFGAPFLPTKRQRVQEALDLLDLQPGQTLLELGSGDGRLLVAAAQRGIKTIGYELNPLLVLWSSLRCWRYRQLVTIHVANFWKQTLPECDGIYTFLLQPYMARLDNKLRNEAKQPLKLVSFAFVIPHKQATSDQNGLYLYKY